MKLKSNLDNEKFEQHLDTDEKPQDIEEYQKNMAKREAILSLYKTAIDSVEQSMKEPNIEQDKMQHLLNRYNLLQKQLKRELEDN